MEIRALCFDQTDKRFRALPYDNATGGLKTDVNTAALAQETTLGLVQSDMSSLNGKVVACDTSALAVEATALASKNSLASLDTKITACDTSALATDATVALGNSSLSNIDTKIVACDTSALATEASQITGNSSLSTIAGAVVASKMQVEFASSLYGANNNLANNVSIATAGFSTIVDVSAMKESNLYYQDSATASFDSVGVQLSVDGVNYFELAELFPYQPSGATIRKATYFPINLSGYSYMRLVNKSSTDTYTNVQAHIVSQS